MDVLKCIGVRKLYGTGSNQTVALDGIDLTVEKGEFIAIVGASGSGKSTLLHILGSVDQPTEGKILDVYKRQDLFFRESESVR